MKQVIRTLPAVYILSLLFLVFSCKDTTETPIEDASFPLPYSTSYQLVYGQALKISFEENKDINYVALFVDGSLLKEWKDVAGKVEDSLDISTFGMGAKSFTLKVKDKQGKIYEDYQTIHVLSDVVPEELKAAIVTMYPHNPKDFTQGLEIVNGSLYEATGDPDHIGATKVMQKDIKTGNVLNEVILEGNYFGEGITVLNNKLYQLTWTSQKCFVYDFPSLFKTETAFSYTGEGWGLTNDGSQIIMSDGSERIYFRDPVTFAVKKVIYVYDNAGKIKNLNELEYVDGLIYANVWMTNKIVVIEPSSGKVLKNIDCTEFARKAKGNGDVLNGIAYNEASKAFYLTGKYWPFIAEVVFK